MERGIGFAVLLLVCSTAFSANFVYECGKSSAQGFNGWSVQPYTAFTRVDFTEETVSFYMENGGDYTILLTRKIEDMQSYKTMQYDIRFDVIENCVLNAVDVFASADGKNWKRMEQGPDELSGIIENPGNYQYVRIAADVSFYKDGYLECSYFKLAGEDPVKAVDSEEELIEEMTEFFVFCFNKSINVETQNEEVYEVIFTNVAGQIMYRETALGSTRIESGLPEGVYIISIVQNGQVIHTKKVLF